MRPLLAGLVLAALTAVSAAGAAPGAAPNPCKLVTATDVKAVLGTAVGRGKLQSLGLYQSCTYRTKSFVTVTVQTRDPVEGRLRQEREGEPAAREGGRRASVAPAYYAAGATLLVWRGGNEATFSVFGGGSGLAREVKLAKRVLRRL